MARRKSLRGGHALGPRDATLSITLDAPSLILVDDIRARVNMPAGIDELLLAGLIGLSEFEDILELISDVRDATDSRG